MIQAADKVWPLIQAAAGAIYFLHSVSSLYSERENPRLRVEWDMGGP